MATIEAAAGAPDAGAPAATLRDPRPGDMGWVVQSHGALYAAEYGFDASFEALVAEIVAKFLASFDASRERCWIADIDGTPGRLGVSGQAVRRGRETAAAAGRSRRTRPGPRPPAGRRMHRLRAAVRLPQDHAVDPEHPASPRAKIYQDAGFVLVATEPHRSFGQDLIGETWEREL